MKEIDIVVAIYNGYEFLKPCLESVLKYTDLKKHRLVLIDDKSPDKKTRDYIQSFKKLKIKTTVIEHKENLGFVAGSNEGMMLSNSADVILLNTDTVVTPNWLEKIQACAYSDVKIATVTPLSNNAYFSSVPHIGKDNELPEGVSIEEMSEVIERISFRHYPEIPVGHGFCMYIKREVIKKIGKFDYEAFGRGYGEEIDLCLRARKAGYKNVIADDTFIYHKGSASYTKSVRNERVENSSKIINSRYPNYDAEQRDFIRQNPLDYLQANIKLATSIFQEEDNRKKVLFIKHHEDTVGGIGINTLQIVRYLDRRFSCYILEPEHNGASCTHFVLSQYIDGDLTTKWTFAAVELNQLVKNLVSFLHVSIIHVQFLIPQLNVNELKKLVVPKFLTLHENSVFAPGNPFLVKKHSTNGANEFFASPIEYLQSLNDKEKRDFLANFAEKIKAFNKVIVPSDYMAQQYNLVFKMAHISSKVETIEHGHELGKKSSLRKINSTKKLNIAYVGHATQHKGVIDLIKLASDKRLANKAKFYIFGVANFNTYNAARILGKLPTLLKIRKTGVYNYDNLRERFEKNHIDIGLVLSPWGETYSYTLSDCIQCNVPVIGRNLGAVGERINRNGYGWIYNNYEELVSTIEKIYEDRKELKEKTKKAVEHTIQSVDLMVEKYQSKYLDMISKNNYDYVINPEFNEIAFYAHSTLFKPTFSRNVKSKIRKAPFGKTIRGLYLEINHLIKDRK